MEKLKMAVIGGGFIGSLHARIIAECPHAQLVAVADINQEKARELGRELGCAAYGDVESMLKAEDIDAVDICTPEKYHVSPVELAAKYHKHILLEKPVAETYEDAKYIARTAEEAGVRLMIGHILHFDPRYATLIESNSKGELGEIVSMSFRRANWKRTVRRLKGGVSFLYYMCVHDIELMLSLNKGISPSKVYAQGVSKINAEVGQQDTAFITVTFSNGSIANLHVCWALPENPGAVLQTSAEVLGTLGAGYVSGHDQNVEIVTDEIFSHPDVMHWPEYNGRMQGDLKEEIHHFADATMRNKPYLVDTGTSVEAIKIIEAALRSMESGAPVELQ
jgi:predicted dehydrogenase